MPLINITVSTPHLKVLPRAEIAAELCRLSTSLLRKDPQDTTVIVHRVAPDDWFVAGKSLTDHWLATFWLDIQVTDGTNTKDEKAAFIGAVYESMEKLLGPLHRKGYVRVHDVRDDAWGFGGKTQAWRYIDRQLSARTVSAA